MKLIRVNNILDSAVFGEIEFDLVICASGFEKRATYLISNYEIKGKLKFCLAFTSFDNLFSRQENDKIVHLAGFKPIVVDGSSNNEVGELLHQIETNVSKTTLSILVDYSSMSRIWYASIINYFKNHLVKFDTVDIFFSYSVGEYVPPPKYQPYTSLVEPLEGFYNLTIPDKPTALIIGLGYEKDRAFGLKEYFDAEEVYLFYTDKKSSENYANEVKLNNEDLFREIRPSNLISYTLEDINNTDLLLLNLCNDLSDKFRVVLAPSGPKPLTLLSLLVNCRINMVDVWRISGGKYSQAVDKIPTGKILIVKTQFTR